MFLLGHVGITLGAAVAGKGLVDLVRGTALRQQLQTQHGPVSGEIQENSSSLSLSNWIESLGKFFDLRLLVLGSMMPDIIDKPLGMFLYGNGRIFTHSLVVTVLALLIGAFLYINYKRTAILAIGCGMVSHLILDMMWSTPAVFLWPLYGWGFAAGTRTDYLHVWLTTLVSVPSAYTTELIGLVILVVIAVVLGSKKKLLTLFKTGRI